MNIPGHLVRFWPRIQSKIFTLLISREFGKMGAGSWVAPPFQFSGLDQVWVGEDVGIAKDCWISTRGASREDGAPKLIIGAHSRVGMGSIIGAGQSVVLGEHVLMAPRVYIADFTHIYENINCSIMEQDFRTSTVSIGRGSWLGYNAVIMPGVNIGQHCVIGAHSVVNRSVPDFCVAAGSPARIVRKYNPHTAQWEKTS